MEARLRGGYWGRQDLHTPLTDSGGHSPPLRFQNSFLFKSGFFCSKIDLAPPSLKSCIPPVEPRLEDCSLRYRQEDLINVEFCKNDPISL